MTKKTLTEAAVRKRLVQFISAILTEAHDKHGGSGTADKPVDAMANAVRDQLAGLPLMVSHKDFARSPKGFAHSLIISLAGDFGTIAILYEYNAKVGAVWPTRITGGGSNQINPDYVALINDALDTREKA